MHASPAFKALVIGGSVGGLATAHELRAAGADIAVYERSEDLCGSLKLSRSV
ncbi:NAD(P)-binding protein [Streptomyces sp. NPDC088736]|uniref:NAD(P)-binding protein n=1 Tax=Streptomyces sp. NPDC088736 TaxID=3365881 RepID=UPI0038024781